MKCDSCGFDLTVKTEQGERSEIGLHIEVGSSAIEYAQVVKLFGKSSFDFCNCCWLKSLGVKPLGKE